MLDTSATVACSFKSVHHLLAPLSFCLHSALSVMCPARVTVELLEKPYTECANLLPNDSASLLMDDTDFHATYNVPASAPANRAPQPTLAAFRLVTPGGSSHSLLAPTHPLIAPIARITTQYPHPALTASGPLTTADGTRSPPTTTHTPSSIALGKRCLVEILFDDEADPVASTSSTYDWHLRPISV
ncbi:hypothetical protein C8J57DRAFT_1718640 [Mycena rebaudengoi]|nr:hypothetical protein C8J57DRAFT_1718640 [Mycena rebaudengoi]